MSDFSARTLYDAEQEIAELLRGIESLRLDLANAQERVAGLEKEVAFHENKAEQRKRLLESEEVWGYWLDEEHFIQLPKLSLQHSGFKPPCQLTRPDGKVLDVVIWPHRVIIKPAVA